MAKSKTKIGRPARNEEEHVKFSINVSPEMAQAIELARHPEIPRATWVRIAIREALHKAGFTVG